MLFLSQPLTGENLFQPTHIVGCTLCFLNKEYRNKRWKKKVWKWALYKQQFFFSQHTNVHIWPLQRVFLSEKRRPPIKTRAGLRKSFTQRKLPVINNQSLLAERGVCTAEWRLTSCLGSAKIVNVVSTHFPKSDGRANPSQILFPGNTKPNSKVWERSNGKKKKGYMNHSNLHPIPYNWELLKITSWSS